jgi:DNA primase
MNALVGRRVKLSKSGRNWKGCCPFHNEKSPSFYVYEDSFHCFGCGAHGDAITFVMQTGGGTFIDAVESLATEAGLEMPQQSPRAAEVEQERLDLFGVLEAAQAEFTRLLRTGAGAEGLNYLRGRGLSDDTIARFGLGWSGDGRGSLIAVLAKAGVPPALMEDAGLVRPPEDGHPARELYWGRVTFPIRDRRGRLISFGGRTLGDAKPKYINGPETRLYQKKQNLYAHDLAREGARKGRLVVAEGYMDVIALHQAGFGAAVAPLGTALTAEQMELLWRMSPAPTLCFDGDEAGARAAARAAELCLPLITPERSLLFARLPSGQDPDSLVRSGGPAAFNAVLDGARPLVQTLFDLLKEGGGEGPEARAAFRARLDGAAAKITDKNLSQEYRGALRQMFFEQARPGGSRRGGGKPRPAVRAPRTALPPDATQAERARCLTALLLRHPGLLRDTEEAYATLDLPPGLDRIREAMLHIEDHAALDSATLLAHLNASGLADDVAAVLSTGMPLPASARLSAMPAEAEGEWWHLFGLMRGLGRLDAEVAEAARAYEQDQTELNLRRLTGLAAARLELVQIEDDA